MTRQRLPALFLLLAMLAGGLGLPVADAALYHSTPAPVATQQGNESSVSAPAAVPHLQTCVLWLTGLTGSGISSTTPAVSTAQVDASGEQFTAPAVVLTRTDVALGHSRAPPIA